MGIFEVLVERDGYSKEDARDLMHDARKDLHERLAQGEMPFDLCEEWFGLEGDYIMELM